MKRTRTSLLRRAVMWTAGVALVVSVAAMLASRWTVAWSDGYSGGVELGNGNLTVYLDASRWAKGWHIVARLEPESDPNRVFGTSLSLPWEQPRYEMRVPTWLLGTGAGTVLLSAWYLGQRQRHVARLTGLCMACGYDLSGITGPCPECGKEQKA